jgi:7-carboxy-7-deazaguanine synthase
MTALKISRLPSGGPEVFHSIQGEGSNIGTPSVFLRLATCNLSCTWCDTRYTWDWTTYDYTEQVVELPQDQILDSIVRFNCRHLIITGGEPLIQQRALISLIQNLKKLNYSFEVETNGTITPASNLIRDVNQWNVSPKLANSGLNRKQRVVPRALKTFASLPTAYFKFVVTNPRDLDEIKDILRECQLPPQRVILMPEGRDAKTIETRALWLSRTCMEEGFRFSPRLHILLWGDKRGT